jgi:hypothetical protein
MNELIQLISQRTGLSPDKAQEVVNVVLSHLKEKLPPSLASSLESFLADGSAGSGGNLEGEAKAIAAGLGGLFGGKAEKA